MATETISPDHSFGSVESFEASGRSLISEEEFSALIMLLHYKNKYTKETNKLFKLTLFNHTFYMDMSHKITKNIKPTENLPYQRKLKSCSEINKIWIKKTREIFNKDTTSVKKIGNKLEFESTSAIYVTVYKDKYKKEYNSNFSFFINKKKVDKEDSYIVNASCSPIQLLVGDNSIPIITFEKAEQKAEYLTQMFMLPFFIIGKLLDKYVLSEKATSSLTKAVEKRNIILQKIQIAGYSKAFKTPHSRNIALESLLQVYDASLIHNNTNFSVDVASALGYSVEKTKTTKKFNKYNQLVSRSGFMLRFNQGNNPTFSFGIYLKDVLNKLKEEQHQQFVKINYTDSFMFAAIEEKETQKYIQKQEVLKNCLRLDLSIYRSGLVTMSNALNKEYNGKISVIDESECTAENIYQFLLEVLTVDITMGIVFKYMFQHQMRIDQILAVNKKQWDKAFDILKSKGYYDLIDNLKKRINVKYSNNEKTSLTYIVKKYTKKEDPSRLRKLIQKETAIYKEITNDDGDTESVLVNPGVDLQFPFRVNQIARRRLRELYENPDYLDHFFETGNKLNKYKPEEITKQARKESMKLFRQLIKGELYHVKIN